MPPNFSTKVAMPSFDMATRSYEPLNQSDEENSTLITIENDGQDVSSQETSFPKRRSIPGKRFILVYLIFLITVCLIFCAKQTVWADPNEILYNTGFVMGQILIICLGIPEAVYLGAHIWTEWRYLKENKHFATKELLKKMFAEHPKVLWLLVSGSLALSFGFVVSENNREKLYYLPLLLGVIGLIFTYYLFTKAPNEYELIALSDEKLCYAIDLARVYVLGYLTLVLPYDCGSDYDFSLGQRIKEFESENEINIPIKKLFILIPLSSYLNSDLSLNECTDATMKLKFIKRLKKLKKDRGGVDRTYNNVVYSFQYKVGSQTKQEYVVAEVASPLMTLYDMSQSSNCYGFSKEELGCQVQSFYIHLKELLESDRRLAGTYSLVYFDDVHKNETLHSALKRQVMKELDRITQGQSRNHTTTGDIEVI